MLLVEAVEEIQEKSSNFLSMESIIRKISGVRNRLLRMYGKEVMPVQMDLLADVPNYPWALPHGSIVNVLVNGVKWPFAQFNQMAGSRYYYFMAGAIGLYPAPEEDAPGGLTVLINKTLVPLTVNDLNAEVGFDMDYDMLVVYGVLKDIETGAAAAEYTVKYDTMLNDYLRADTVPEAHQIIPEVDW